VAGAGDALSEEADLAASESADLAASACAGVVVCGVIVVTELMLEIAMPEDSPNEAFAYRRELNDGDGR